MIKAISKNIDELLCRYSYKDQGVAITPETPACLDGHATTEDTNNIDNRYACQ